MYEIKNRCLVTSNDFYKKINHDNFISHRKQNSSYLIPIKDSFAKLPITNSQINLLKNQSPKLSVGVLRNKGKLSFKVFKYKLIKERNENWSLLDIDYKKVSTGLKMPKQYDRNNNNLYFYKSFYNAKEKNNFLKSSNAENKNNNSNIINKVNANIEINNKVQDQLNSEREEAIEAKEKSFDFGLKNESNEIKDKNNNSRNKDNKDINSIKDKDSFCKKSSDFGKIDNFGLEYFKVNSKTNNPIKLNHKDNNKGNNINGNLKIISKEAPEPKSLLVSLKNHGLEHQRLIKESIDQTIKNPHLIIYPKKISKEMFKSDIFFQKELSYREDYKLNNNFEKFISNVNNEANKIHKNLNNTALNFYKTESHKYQDSDIFLLKNNETSVSKIDENHLLRENSSNLNKNKFNITSRSNSEWVPKNKILSLMNHESTNYDFFNPQMKKNFYTKIDIFTFANGSNPNKIQKGISEMIDLSRVGAPNMNKEYLRAFENDKTIFRKRGNIGESFSNLHKEYRNICDNPFAKKLI